MELIIRKIIQKPKSKMKQDKLDKAIVVICFLVLGICMILYYIQENTKDKKLKECSYFTVGYPIRIVKNTLEFYFSVNDKKILSSTSTGAEVVGPFYNTSQLLNRKLWVKFNCMDPNINRVSWNIDMPDSLNFVPKQGWKALPYNLKEKDKTIFDEN